ncbi:MAG TPA: hypothetical protein VNJ70_19490 [Thermoanaerobaculia bacterium]|nr:hypothetical protein [Thermoanaerobaculia bacterium]
MIHPASGLAALAVLLAAAVTCARGAPELAGTPPAIPPRSAAAPAHSTPAHAVDFQTQVKPLLEARCSPCHFASGRMYEKLPFDEPATIHHLGEQLFTRIEAADEQALLRAFLAQSQRGQPAPE